MEHARRAESSSGMTSVVIYVDNERPQKQSRTLPSGFIKKTKRGKKNTSVHRGLSFLASPTDAFLFYLAVKNGICVHAEVSSLVGHTSKLLQQ